MTAVTSKVFAMAQNRVSLDHIKCEPIDPSEAEDVLKFILSDFIKVSTNSLGASILR